MSGGRKAKHRRRASAAIERKLDRRVAEPPACNGKKPYPTYATANQAAILIARRPVPGTAPDSTLYPYKCRNQGCKQWHLTSRPPSPH